MYKFSSACLRQWATVFALRKHFTSHFTGFVRSAKLTMRTWDGTKALLPRVRWFNLTVLTVTPAIWLYGACTTTLRGSTLIWSIVYYAITMLGITAGYHRLWSHRSYKASRALQYLLILMGSSAVQGYTDTPLDPYNAKRGLLYSHIGWMLVKPTTKPGYSDISDLQKDWVVQWQHRWYFIVAALMGYVLPAVVAGLGWNDWWGGLYYAGMMRMTIAHHSTFCINSVAHYLGESHYDDRKTARDHFLSGKLRSATHHASCYHNFHHQFPMDYRNATKWYQYDPTKWFIAACAAVGLASNLHVFPDGEIRKSELSMVLKALKKVQDSIRWPAKAEELPVVSWDTYQEQAKKRALVVVSGFVHDVTDFVDQHPGGKHVLLKRVGKDATAAFCGGAYDHGNAAHNLLAMMRVGVLLGGIEHVKTITPGERLRIVKVLE
ncbi:hypothetical protein BN946_scf185043.g248 [Trametes cinnabarina]|uniref:Acyl-CoA desaturase n=1 Tax=Pycnoporus cinnabarinus TaxID=5643 RepID=A0A060SJ31_PYCCI|nr:hypothetical protein BN946_scf185043.g248 [Trametes cinnabarina]